jgi:alpha-L-fucosidase
MVPEGEQYAAYARGHLRELITRYRPSIIWNDIGFPKGRETLQIIADYYNATPDGVIDDRWSVDIGDFTTPEYQQYDTITTRKWESTRGLGYSFGYNRMERAEHMLSVDQLVDFFVDVVSKNGNVLLNVGPRADGSVSELQTDRVLGLGEWLAANGDGIYGTRAWRVAEGVTADSARVRFTQKNGRCTPSCSTGRPGAPSPSAGSEPETGRRSPCSAPAERSAGRTSATTAGCGSRSARLRARPSASSSARPRR